MRSPRPSHGSFADPFSKINDIRKKTPRKMEKSQFGKKSAKVYLFAYCIVKKCTTGGTGNLHVS
jgi:hypothetical protein